MGKIKLKNKQKKSINVIVYAAIAFVLMVAVVVAIILHFAGRGDIDPAETKVSLEGTTTTEAGPSTTEPSVPDREITENADTSSSLATMEMTEESQNTVETETPAPPIKREPADISILAVGDNLIHKEIVDTLDTSKGYYDFWPVYENMQSVISTADVAILNQEVPCAGNEWGISGYPSFNAPTEVLDIAAKLGFDVLTLATNHSLDQGELGLTNTLKYLHTKYPNILTTGTHATYEDSLKTPIIEVKGVKIAVLNFSYGTNFIKPYNDYCMNLLYSSEYEDKVFYSEKISAAIQRAKADADFVIFAPHWGIEYSREVSRAQREVAQFVADCGVDLIIGNHPHVPQALEFVTAQDGRQVPVYYSLGNFVGAQAQVPRALGGIAEVTLHVDENGKITIAKCDYDFVTTFFTAKNFQFTGFKLYMARNFPMDRILEFGIYLWQPYFTFQDYLDVIYSLNPYWVWK